MSEKKIGRGLYRRSSNDKTSFLLSEQDENGNGVDVWYKISKTNKLSQDELALIKNATPGEEFQVTYTESTYSNKNFKFVDAVALITEDIDMTSGQSDDDLPDGVMDDSALNDGGGFENFGKIPGVDFEEEGEAEKTIETPIQPEKNVYRQPIAPSTQPSTPISKPVHSQGGVNVNNAVLGEILTELKSLNKRMQQLEELAANAETTPAERADKAVELATQTWQYLLSTSLDFGRFKSMDDMITSTQKVLNPAIDEMAKKLFETMNHLPEMMSEAYKQSKAQQSKYVGGYKPGQKKF